ncbi:heterokaryon incompatibility protein-domain-containing protein [Amylocarpus encephaloides]|uniref:Heterokaryon incompatibility protein-domain-containing protein n=1 Tax=Amylocarpus encephaloides TaxID=45428 RepID=A0A9P8C6L1_9HELO|nr:heterokaryon incompatibility protein-domain-containing protein [Amylocarpus encephaloides]
MRLIHTTTYKLREFYGNDIPPYAILSHRWETEEVTAQEIMNLDVARRRRGWEKIQGCCEKARKDGWDFCWIDSCCIDKSSSAELSEAINSMFDWYRCAQVCYAYLSDVSWKASDHWAPSSDFRLSRWFTRGWTLQELLAPHWIQFFDQEWNEIGTKSSLGDLISSITGITHLFNFNDASVAQKMCWASKRESTRIEDQAYSLMGLFNVKMPPLYGEGRHAFMRLQHEIINRTDDETIFAWKRHSGLAEEGGMLAPSPAYFERSGLVRTLIFDPERPPHTLTNKGLRLELLSLGPATAVEVIAPLNCVDGVDQLALRLWKNHSMARSYARGSELHHLGTAFLKTQSMPRSVFFVGQTPDDPPSPFPQRVVFDTRNIQSFGFSLVERQVYPIAGCAHWVWANDDGRGPTLHHFKPYWQRAAVVLEKIDYLTLILILGISKKNHLWVDVVYQERAPGAPPSKVKLSEDGTTDRISRTLPDGRSTTLLLKKDRLLGHEGYVVEATLDPKGGIPWPGMGSRQASSQSSFSSPGLESKPFLLEDKHSHQEKEPKPLTKALSAMSFRSKPDRKSSFGISTSKS